MDAEVFGLSPDSQKSHARFRQKLDLPFRLLVDTDHKVADAYGVWVNKSTFGVSHMGIERSTFIVGRDGRLAHVLRKVKAQGHAKEVRELVEKLAKQKWAAP